MLAELANNADLAEMLAELVKDADSAEVLAELANKADLAEILAELAARGKGARLTRGRPGVILEVELRVLMQTRCAILATHVLLLAHLGGFDTMFEVLW